ncbi:MAG: hypothetical protein Kow00117_12580 [Phototrophicales bacterium]
MRYKLKPMNRTMAERIIRWRYASSQQGFGHHFVTVDAQIDFFINPINQYYVLKTETDDVVAICRIKADQPMHNELTNPLDVSDNILDIEINVRPDLITKGQGHRYIHLLLQLMRQQFHARHFRVTIAESNMQALRLYQQAGFQPVDTYQRADDGQRFIILMTKEQQLCV